MKIKHDKKQTTTALLKWYEMHARILPWRDKPTSYHVWVSEIMLQQTRIEAVKPYYERFIDALPTLSSLAYASDEQLAKLWEGLGYYRRISNMKLAAIICMQEHHGELPHSYVELLKLPGIGPYTAGAIASIAFNEKCCAIDGNVLRVFSRLLCSEDDILKESTKKKFREIVTSYMPKDKSADFNQAIMELGEVVCIPNGAPLCHVCPLQDNCIAYQKGMQLTLPNKTPKKKRRIENHTLLLFTFKEEVLLHQRNSTGLLASLYEFINIDEELDQGVIENGLRSKGIPFKSITLLPNYKHIFSHIEWHINGFHIELIDQIEVENEYLWANSSQLISQYTIPTAFQKYLQILLIWWNRRIT
ncbi:MAG: A/G-specific adenine glycosylase [Erysipelotrichaceae bacterium]